MKTTIYELLGMIKDNKAPKLILFKDRQWNYDEKEKDYVNIFNEWLFDGYVISNIVNCEVEILETTITYKPDKIEKLDLTEVEGKIYGTYATYIDIAMGNKINEIIDRVNAND